MSGFSNLFGIGVLTCRMGPWKITSGSIFISDGLRLLPKKHPARSWMGVFAFRPEQVDWTLQPEGPASPHQLLDVRSALQVARRQKPLVAGATWWWRRSAELSRDQPHRRGNWPVIIFQTFLIRVRFVAQWEELQAGLRTQTVASVGWE